HTRFSRDWSSDVCSSDLVGYRVIEARDGEEGVSRAREHLPDLILMDISIPKLDGWEATQRLKSDDGTRDIPIIALTAHALEEDQIGRASCRESTEISADG